jgi:uncharacterized protein (DUF2164 family)
MLKVKLTEAEKKRLIDRVQHYFATERDESLGQLAAENILDFFMDELAGEIYNKGLDDAKEWFSTQISELDYDYANLYK